MIEKREHADYRPMVTKEEIKEYFPCGDDMADEIWRCPSLPKKAFGKRERVDRGDWEAFLDEFYKRDGCTNFKRGFGVMIPPLHSSLYNWLKKCGHTEAEIEELINAERKKRQERQTD